MEKFDAKQCDQNFRTASDSITGQIKPLQGLVDGITLARQAINSLGEFEAELSRREKLVTEREAGLSSLDSRISKSARQAGEAEAKLKDLQNRISQAQELATKLDGENESKVLRGKALDEANKTKAGELGAKIAQEVLSGKGA